MYPKSSSIWVWFCFNSQESRGNFTLACARIHRFQPKSWPGRSDLFLQLQLYETTKGEGSCGFFVVLVFWLFCVFGNRYLQRFKQSMGQAFGLAPQSRIPGPAGTTCRCGYGQRLIAGCLPSYHIGNSNLEQTTLSPVAKSYNIAIGYRRYQILIREVILVAL